MNILNHDINKAKILLSNSNCKQFDNIYPFCNENIKELFSYFNFKEKECLSILGGSDQIFDMFLRGAKSVTAFDINSLTLHYFYLKRAALIANISLEEYKRFFCYESYKDNIECNGNAFNNETFSKIKNYLDEKSYIFGILYLQNIGD